MESTPQSEVTVGGILRGSRPLYSTTDHFGFVADEIVKVTVGGYAIPLRLGANNDTSGIPVGATGDFTIRELLP
jgi:hypothetical protein